MKYEAIMEQLKKHNDITNKMVECIASMNNQPLTNIDLAAEDFVIDHIIPTTVSIDAARSAVMITETDGFTREQFMGKVAHLVDVLNEVSEYFEEHGTPQELVNITEYLPYTLLDIANVVQAVGNLKSAADEQ